MTNDKNLFNQLDDLFEEINVDQASLLVGGEIKPSQNDYESELIEKLNNNEIELTDQVISEIRSNITEGGDVDLRLTEYLRNKYALDEEQEEVEEISENYSIDIAQPKVIKEEAAEAEDILQPLDHIQALADQLGGYVKKNNLEQKPESEHKDSLTEKVEYLSSQLGIIRQALDEQGQTIVAGIGQGGDGQTPGSGEVRLQKMDDVDMDGIKPGQTVCWDPDLNSGTGGWYPCDGGGGGGGGTIQPATTGAVFGCQRVKGGKDQCADLYWGSKDDYDTWYNDGVTFGDIRNTNAKPIQSDIKAIAGCFSLEYTPSSTYPGANESDNWIAAGLVDCDDNILPPESVSASGTSSPLGPEGYFLVYDDPSDCGEGDEGCDGTAVDYIGCSPVLPVDEDDTEPDAYTNELKYGDQVDYDSDPQSGVSVEDENGDPIVGVNAILAISFEGCDKDTMEGKYSVYYATATGIKVAYYTDSTVGAQDRSFFIANANCDTTVEPPEEQEQVIGCLAVDGCKEVSGVDEDGDVNKYGQIYFGNGVVDDSDKVLDDSGSDVDNAQKLLFVVSKKDEIYTIDEITGEITAIWTVTYLDFDGNTKFIDYEGTIDITTCETGFFIESPNQCLNPLEEIEEEGDTKPWPGQITGCGELAEGSPSGKMYWGDGDASNSSPAKTGPGNTGSEINDAVKIIYVFSTDPAVNETDKVGSWNCLYKKSDDSYGIAFSANANVDDGSTQGFFLDTDSDTSNAICADGGDELPELNFGIFTGCREKATGSSVYWNTRTAASLGATDNIASYPDGSDANNALKLYRPFSLDNKTYFSVVVTDNNNRPDIAIHMDDGTTSPRFGLYIGGAGSCIDETEEESCPLKEIEYVPPVGCREGQEGTDLLFGPISLIDDEFVGDMSPYFVDDNVIKILSVYTEDKCDNNYGKWNCLYSRFNNSRSTEEVKLVTREGIYTADVYEDSETFFLDTSDVPCADESGDIGNGPPVSGIITGCRRTLESAGTTLHWGDGTPTNEIIKDVSGNDVTDAKFIVGVVSLNSGPDKFGDWICLFRRADGSYDTAITYGQSPTDGYFLEGSNCDPDECDGDIYAGFLPYCNEVDPNFEAGELYWNNGDDDIDNLPVVDENGTQVLARKVLITFTVDECEDGFDVTNDNEWLALYFDENNKLSLLGSQTGKSPMGGYYIEVDELNSFCAYEDSVIGGSCESDLDCPLGFTCIGGVCEQMRCESSDGCPEGFDCVNGVCLKPCGEGEDALCPPGYHCQQIGDNDLTYCIPGKGCNGDCPEGYFCLNGECVILECPLTNQDGLIGDGCPPGTECHLGQCLKPCPGGDGDCPPGFFCTDGYCFPILGPCPPGGCPPDHDCVLGACRPSCNVDDGSCEGPFECLNGHCFPECPPDQDCPEGYKCIGGVCYPSFIDCNVDGDCGGAFECLNGICLPPCDPVEGCPEGMKCYLGVCVPECSEDSPCPDGFQCMGGICVPIIGCNVNSDGTDNCPTGTTCIDGLCKPSCTDDSMCPDGYSCFLGICYPDCDTEPCPPDHICLGGKCIPELSCDPNETDPCPNGFDCIDGICRPVCDPDPGVEPNCPPGWDCFDTGNGTICVPPCDSGVCPPGHECIGGFCIPPFVCDDDQGNTRPCPPGWGCTPEGICRPLCPGGDDDCDNGQCIGDRCWQTCSDTTPCPDGFDCVDGKCIPQIGCNPNRPCPTGYECVGGICRQVCDDSTNDCPTGFDCWNGHCFPECPSEGCPEGHKCIGGHCIPITGCSDENDCPTGYDCFNGICLPSCDGTPCPLGTTCIDGICLPDGCNNTDDCPDGFICWDGKCYPQLICDENRPCPDGYECLNGTCVQSCTPPDGTQGPCPDGYVCVDPDGVCLKECTDGDDCPPGTICVDGICVPIFNCDRPGGCPDGYECFGGICLPTCPNGSNDECPADHKCDDGVCKTECDVSNPCPIGFVCVDGFCEAIGRPDGPCEGDDNCPEGFECVDGFCRRICAEGGACPPGYICMGGNCFPGTPEGPCADGVCPPGYECFMGICRKPCAPDGSCPDLFECNDPPGGCWPLICQDDTDCGPDGACVDGRCREICTDGDCEPGYECVQVSPNLNVCLPITEGPGGPEQPVDPGPNEHPAVGCERVDKCGLLYWGSEEDFVNNTGELQQNSNGPIEVSKIELITASDVYPNGFGTFTVFYKDCDTDDIRLHTVQKQSPINDDIQSFYIKPDDDALCVDFGDTHEPYPGLIAGCKETDNGGTIHWGTIPEGISDNYPNAPLEYPDGNPIIAKGIMYVFSINSVDPEDGAPGQIGIWNIFYQAISGEVEVTTVYGRSGPQGPEGAFMRASEGSRCIDDPFGITTTRDVILVNSPRILETRNSFLGKNAQGTDDIIGPNGEIIRYETQEQANLLNLDLLEHLDKSKPTVHVIEDINNVKGYYVPQRGDLWIDPTNYSIYVCEITGNPSNEQILEKPDHYVAWIELGAAAGGGGSGTGGGSNIFLQDSQPSPALVQHADMWIDAKTYLAYVFESRSGSWVSITGDIKAVLDNRFEVSIGNSPPPLGTTKSGDLWFDSEVAEMRVAYIPDGSNEFVWVPVQGTGHKYIPQNTNPFADGQESEMIELQAQMSRLSTRLTALENINN